MNSNGPIEGETEAESGKRSSLDSINQNELNYIHGLCKQLEMTDEAREYSSTMRDDHLHFMEQEDSKYFKIMNEIDQIIDFCDRMMEGQLKQ